MRNNWNQIQDYIFKWFPVFKNSSLAINSASNQQRTFNRVDQTRLPASTLSSLWCSETKFDLVDPPGIEPKLFRNYQIVYHKTVNGLSPTIKWGRIPSWNIPGRPKSPKTGIFGFNFQTNDLEIWDGSKWQKLPMKRI